MPHVYNFWKIFKRLVHLKNENDMLRIMQKSARYKHNTPFLNTCFHA